MTSGEPLISCLMVTLPSSERFAFFQRSIASYQRQIYPNRELVIVLNGGDDGYRQRMIHYVATLGDASVRVVDLPGLLGMGALRNKSIASARGPVACQWDDDDLYHPDRLLRQHRALVESGAEAVLLRDVMQLFIPSRNLFLTNWHATEIGAFPGSVMSLTSAGVSYPEAGARKQFGEDTAFAGQFLARGRVHILAEVPHLYIYVTHGRNSFSEEHHRMLSRELAVSRGLLLRREALLRNGLREIDFGPGPISVLGSNGPAFVLEDKIQGNGLAPDVTETSSQ